MRSLLIRSLTGLVCLALVPHASFGQGNAYGKQKHEVQEQDDNDDRDETRDPKAHVRIVFSTRDRETIRDYFHNRYSNLPPGLAKRGGNLPPGLQKHLERDGTLPPGLQKRISPFPVDLERRLPQLPNIYVRGSIGTDVVILNRQTQRVVDIIHDILRP